MYARTAQGSCLQEAPGECIILGPQKDLLADSMIEDL